METSLSYRRFVVAVMLIACLSVPAMSVFTGCGTAVKPVKVVGEWIVGFATETGKFVVEKAENFADALAAAWRAFWGTDKLIVNNVEVDKENPLRGKYRGVLQHTVKWHRTENNKLLENELSGKLTNPRMIRKSADSTEWDLAPEEIERIQDLQKQLMKVT